MDVASWLRNLGLEQYEAAFRENGVSAEDLCHLTAEDLYELGVTAIGHRRRLLVAIAALRSELHSVRHHLNRPVGRSTHGELTMAGAQIDRGRGPPALLAPQLGQHRRERPIAMVAKQQAHREYRLLAAAVQLKAAFGPVEVG